MPDPVVGENGLWLEKHPLILASGSRTRLTLLVAAGVPVEVLTPVIDERDVELAEIQNGADSSDIPLALARAKASSIAIRKPDRLVLGADQTLTVGREQFHKAKSLAEAALQIASLSGRQHELHSAVSVWRGAEELFGATAVAVMTMRQLSVDFIGRYVEACGAEILSSVGGYQLERMGIHLFERIEGDQSTILGLPLFPLLNFLRSNGSLAG